MRRRDFFVASATAASVTPAVVAGCLGDSGAGDNENGPNVTLSATKNRLELPNDSFVLEATNEGNEPFTTTPTLFVLRKRTSSGSVWLYPPWDVFSRDGPAGPIEPDDSITEDVEVSNDTDFGGGSSYEIGGIGPGEYVIDYAYRRDEYLAEDEVFDAPSVSFDVVGEPPEIEPVGVRDVERTDGVVIVHTEWGEGDEATLRKTETDDAPPLVVEQIVRIPLLHNLIYYADEGVEQVTLKNLGGAVRQMEEQLDIMAHGTGFEYDGVFRYDGDAYEFEKE